jgi:hypothetical protein
MKDHYSYDIGIQKYVAIGTGLDVPAACLMHLNREYIFGGGEYDLSTLFAMDEITPEIEIGPAEISERVRTQLNVLEEPEAPNIAPGPHCTEPIFCEFFEHRNPPVPPDHVCHLPRITAEKITELIAAGISSIRDIPADYPLSERQRTACEAVRSGGLWIAPELAEDLSQLRYRCVSWISRRCTRGCHALLVCALTTTSRSNGRYIAENHPTACSNTTNSSPRTPMTPGWHSLNRSAGNLRVPQWSLFTLSDHPKPAISNNVGPGQALL